jgi:hypothetical protein
MPLLAAHCACSRAWLGEPDETWTISLPREAAETSGERSSASESGVGADADDHDVGSRRSGSDRRRDACALFGECRRLVGRAVPDMGCVAGLQEGPGKGGAHAAEADDGNSGTHRLLS